MPIPALLALAALSPALAQSAAGTASTMVVSRVDAVMPAGVTGEARASCKVAFKIGTEGAPEPVAPVSVTVTACDEPFKGAAEEAARQWRFQPNLLGGKAYPYTYTAQLDFRHTTSSGTLNHELAADPDASASGGIVVLNRAQPEIPEDWQRALKAEGLEEIFWRVRIQVGPDGKPTGAHVLEAPEFLRRELVDAAMLWRFEPVVVEDQAQRFKYLWEHRWVPL